MRTRPAMLLALLAPAALATDFGFAPPVVLTFTAHSNPVLILAQDVTGDGLPDIIVASYDTGLILVRNNEGGLEFGAALPTLLPGPVDRWAAGDMNGDGLTDLVLRVKGDSRVRVLLSDGANAFT